MMKDLKEMVEVIIGKNYMILSSTGEKVLIGAGSISHKKAIEKAKNEYKKYQVKTISPVEKEYLNTLKGISDKIENKDKK